MSRALRIALGLSAGFHLALAGYFLIVRKRSEPLKHGSISVAFIEAVPHGILADPHHHPGKKAKAENKAQNAATPVKPSGPVGDPDSQARESDRYILAVTQLINARKIYPRRAVEREEEGRVIVGVTLDREGHVVASALEEKSAFESLNQAALDTIKAVGKFPPLPDQVPDPIHLHVPLIFKVEGR